MPRAALLATLLLASASAGARPPNEHACRTLWSAYEIQIELLSAAVATAQARPRDPESLARVQALRDDLRRALAEIVIAGCI